MNKKVIPLVIIAVLSFSLAYTLFFNNVNISVEIDPYPEVPVFANAKPENHEEVVDVLQSKYCILYIGSARGDVIVTITSWDYYLDLVAGGRVLIATSPNTTSVYYIVDGTAFEYVFRW